ncbi:hypothetical protein HG421_12750 [Xanthomonas campestris pv. badrii]|uniref:Secreted protein n=1 Tax=Xanthomonas campestris pv. badrii TaxID=149696 RepID=A0A7Z2ZHW3_XANCA|nr:hypothetical protein [Xanthomonas campestris]QJD68487.1 hypothetical protein HG421_12750 [Xanthomonas campestris pv. badrii]
MNKLVGLVSILLTLFRSNVCWAKPNHAFFYCQHSFAIFFQPAIAMCGIDAGQVRRARQARHVRGARQHDSVFKKTLLFRCFLQAMKRCAAGAAALPAQRGMRCGIARRLSAS